MLGTGVWMVEMVRLRLDIGYRAHVRDHVRDGQWLDIVCGGC